MWNIVRSFVITALVSIGTAFALSSILGFWQTAVGVTVIQYLVFFIRSSIDQRRGVIQSLQADIDSIISRTEIEVECPCGKSKSVVNIFMDDEPLITCETCNNTYRVVANVTTQLITEPTNLNKLFTQLAKLSEEPQPE